MPAPEGRTGPLAGLRIIDLTQYAPGPFCTMVLGDLGADVVTVSRVRTQRVGGDRRWAALPNLMEVPTRPENDALKRNKRQIRIDLAKDEGRALLGELLRDADVLVTESRPSSLERLGLSWDRLSRSCPKLVHCAISGFGQDGPDSARPGHDLTYLARSGGLSVFGMGERRGVPHNVIADYAGGGLMAAVAILAAVHERSRSTQGQLVDLSMTDGTAYLHAEWFSNYFDRGDLDTAVATGSHPLYATYKTGDGRTIAFAPVEPWMFVEFADRMNRPDLIALAGTDSRRQLRVELEALFDSMTLAELGQRLEGADVPWEPVVDIADIERDDQMRARNMVVEVPAGDGKSTRQVGIGPKFSRSRAVPRFAGRSSGADTRDILNELGYDDAAIEQLMRRGVVASAPDDGEREA